MGQPELTLKNVPDNDLFLQYRQNELLLGEETAEQVDFNEIFEEYQSMIFNVAFRILGNFDDALELTQEVFITVYRKLSTFRGKSSLKTWLYRITVNKASNKLRWWKVRHRNSTCSIQGMEYPALTSLNLHLSQSIKTPEQSCLGREVEEHFQNCLQKIPVKYRITIIMRDIEGLTYEEIADSLQISLGTVKSRIARAREQLRDLLDKHL